MLTLDSFEPDFYTADPFTVWEKVPIDGLRLSEV